MKIKESTVWFIVEVLVILVVFFGSLTVLLGIKIRRINSRIETTHQFTQQELRRYSRDPLGYTPSEIPNSITAP